MTAFEKKLNLLKIARITPEEVQLIRSQVRREIDLERALEEKEKIEAEMSPKSILAPVIPSAVGSGLGAMAAGAMFPGSRLAGMLGSGIVGGLGWQFGDKVLR